MVRLGAVLLALSASIVIAVRILETHWIYVYAGTWGKGFGLFCLFLTWALFVGGAGLIIIALLRKCMCKER